MNKKKYLFALIVIIFIVIATLGCVENNEKKDTILTVTFDDYTDEYSLSNLESIESYSGTGRYIKTKLLPDSIVISDSVNYTGVRMYRILNNIPNLPEDYNISVISSDDWTVTYTKDDINGNVDVYDEEGNILSNETAVMIIVYKEEGEYYSEIDLDDETGPLRIAFVKGDVITSSNLWSKMVVSIEIISP
jgi:hypothetical protein